MLMPMEDRCYQRSMIHVQHVIKDFSNGQYKLFERLWTRLAKKSVWCQSKNSLERQSRDNSISIKASLGRNDGLDLILQTEVS